MGHVDAERKGLELLFEIVELLKQIKDQDAPAPDPYGVNAYFEDKGNNATLEMLVAASLPSSPDMQAPVTISPVAGIIASNQTSGLQYIVVSNDDIAQPMWVGPEGVLNSTGRRIPQRGSVPFVLAPGAALWGICNVATLSARVSRGYPIAGLVGAVRTEGQP